MTRREGVKSAVKIVDIPELIKLRSGRIILENVTGILDFIRLRDVVRDAPIQIYRLLALEHLDP